MKKLSTDTRIIFYVEHVPDRGNFWYRNVAEKLQKFPEGIPVGILKKAGHYKLHIPTISTPFRLYFLNSSI